MIKHASSTGDVEQSNMIELVFSQDVHSTRDGMYVMMCNSCGV